MAKRLDAAKSYHGDQRSWHFTDVPGALGCNGCAEFSTCGGLRTVRALFNCLDYCQACTGDCGSVCPHSPTNFVRRVREIGGNFDLSPIPRTTQLNVSTIPSVVPIIFHRGQMREPHRLGAACVPFHRVFSMRDGTPVYPTAIDIRDAFNLHPDTPLILTGVAQDRWVEAWWGLGHQRRRLVISSLKDLGIALVTVPNFSLTMDEPRWTDLHAIKRIGICHWEFQAEGVPAALHINARTDRDYDRWIEFLLDRPEITHVSVELLTGGSRPKRMQWHAEKIVSLAAHVGRPLHLVVRGGTAHIPEFTSAFAHLTILTANSFMKTVMRQKLIPFGNDQLQSVPARTLAGESLDALWRENWEQERAWLGAMCQSVV